MKKLTRYILVLCILFFCFESFAGSIIAYKIHNDWKCILLNNENNPVACWRSPYSATLSNLQAIDINKNRRVGKLIKQKNPSLSLDNIVINIITDQTQINHWESIQISTIKTRHFIVGKDFRISSPTNAISTAQDYNSSRSNKANSIATNPLYNGNPSSGNNPMHENKIAIGGSGDSTLQHQPNAVSTAQDYNSSRSNKANSLFLSGGSASGNKDGSIDNGFTFNIGYQIPLNSVLNIEVESHYFINHFNYKPSALLPDKYLLELKNNEENKKWSSLGITVGPSVNIGRKALYATVYAKAGILFINIPNQFIGAANQNGEITDASGLAKFSGKQTSALFNTGLRINYNIRSYLTLFFSPYFSTSLKSNINYQEKNVSLAIDADGNFNQDKFSSLPYVQKQTGFRNYGVQLGIRIR